MSDYAESTAFLQSLATDALLGTQSTTSKIWNLTEGNNAATLLETGLKHSVTKPSLGAVPKLTDVLELGDTTDAWRQKLDADTDAWMAKYFPAMGAGLQTLPEDWLVGIISGVKPFGLDQTVFELVWHRARDRAYRTLSSEQRQIEAAFSGRGFTLPPGAMAVQLAAASERAGDAIAEVNREQALRDADIKLELMRFAMEQALNYKRGIMQALAEFMRQWISLPNRDLERARIKTQAMSSLYGALSSYYNVELSWEELLLKVKQLKAETDAGIDRNRIDRRKALDDSGRASALGQAARAFSDVAAQAANSAGTLVAQVENI